MGGPAENQGNSPVEQYYGSLEKCHSCERRNLEPLDITGLPLEFIPFLIRDRSDKMIMIRGSLIRQRRM